MASLDATFVGQANGYTSLSSYSDSLVYAGYADDWRLYAASIKFTAPTFSGISESVTFTINMGEGLSTTATLRYAICTSDANIKSYMNTSEEVSDQYQIASGTINVTAPNEGYINTNTFTINTTKLQSDSTFYLILWAGASDSSGGMGLQNRDAYNNTPSAIITYNDGYILTISQGEGSTITVKKDGSILSDGASISNGDVLTISFDVDIGYDLITHTVNGEVFTSGNTYTVTGDVSVISAASLKKFILTILQGEGSIITVTRNGTQLSNGETITYGDPLFISFETDVGYELSNTSHDNGSTHIVVDNTTVSSIATLLSYILSISKDVGSNVVVNRINSPKANAKIGELLNGETIYYFDVLTIQFYSNEEYEMASNIVNGLDFISGDSHIVTNAVDIVATSEVLSYFIGNGVDYDKYCIYIDNGTRYDEYVAYIGNGTTWEIYN
jgi:hypothetical protein